MLFSGCQLDNLVLINKIKEQLMAEKIRPPHLSAASAASQQPLPAPPGQAEGGQHGMSKTQQIPGLHSGGSSQPDIALHARPASSSVTGVALASRTGNLNTSEIITSPTSTSSSHSRLGGAPPHHLLSGLAGGHRIEPGKSNGGLLGLLGPPPKDERGRKKIKAENGSSLLVVPYPILASGNEQSCVTISAKEGKTYRCKVCPLTFFSKSDMQIHSKTHTEAKAHKCSHCTKTFTNVSYLAQHLRIHLGVKPYRCSYCEKCFRQLSHLQQHTRSELSAAYSHQRQHNKDKPFKCSNCYRAYSDSASLQIHMSAHAIKNAKAYCCTMCGRAYTSETYLMKHMSKHAMVEHVMPHLSPHRTESPNIPIRISLI
ncbi:unnamed protein product [Menidia menidia]|uniref:(Atlantic silverside) hypothetical protein n=1 Tax=Menidia menidia TaxID=238744 RepID=A0A8S4BH67_9TELE|nr:unnamed protein product [Menidia menidia]